MVCVLQTGTFTVFHYLLMLFVGVHLKSDQYIVHRFIWWLSVQRSYHQCLGVVDRQRLFLLAQEKMDACAINLKDGVISLIRNKKQPEKTALYICNSW